MPVDTKYQISENEKLRVYLISVYVFFINPRCSFRENKKNGQKKINNALCIKNYIQAQICSAENYLN